jgi:hypothetical protein
LTYCKVHERLDALLALLELLDGVKGVLQHVHMVGHVPSELLEVGGKVLVRPVVYGVPPGQDQKVVDQLEDPALDVVLWRQHLRALSALKAP